MPSAFYFQQLIDSDTSTYSYLLADQDTREAVVIDPVKEKVSRDLQLLKELELNLIYILDTHVHADHVTGSGLLRAETGAKVALSEGAQVSGADLSLKDQQKIHFGQWTIQAIATPGHTSGCMSYYVHDRVFTGDTLLIRGTGRTDFQGGCPERLFESLRQKLFQLPGETLVYPGHDYKGMTCSTIDQEKQWNSRAALSIEKAQFIKIMNELKLPYPKRIDEAVPANLKLGLDSPRPNS